NVLQPSPTPGLSLPPTLTTGLLLASVFSKLPSTINSVASTLPTNANPPARTARPIRFGDCRALLFIALGSRFDPAGYPSDSIAPGSCPGFVRGSPTKHRSGVRRQPARLSYQVSSLRQAKIRLRGPAGC